MKSLTASQIQFITEWAIKAKLEIPTHTADYERFMEAMHEATRHKLYDSGIDVMRDLCRAHAKLSNRII